jgi:hypothetical protein
MEASTGLDHFPVHCKEIPEKPHYDSGRLESWWNLCTQKRDLMRPPEIPLAKEADMPSTPLTPAQRAEAQALAQAIREAADAETEELARTLVTTDDAHLFGDTEFTVRALAHKIAAKAFEQHLARKKPATTAPA